MEYERLVELGVFQPGERVELLDGLLAVREPQGSRDAAAIRRVLSALHRALGDTWQIDSQLPIALDDDSEPEPDISVLPRDPRAYRDAHPSHPVLIVEVADGSYRIDRHFKASLYARAGIPEYWIVHLTTGTLEVHREPERSAAAAHGWHYRTVIVLEAGATLRPLVAPDRVLAVAHLFP